MSCAKIRIVVHPIGLPPALDVAATFPIFLIATLKPLSEVPVRVSVMQENLAKGLSIVGRAVSSRSTLPVLGNILLEAKDNQLRLAATNLEIGVNCWIGAKVEDEGAITVPARLLTEFVGSLPPERIDMELSVRTQTLHLRCARFDANMKGIDAADFPIVPTMEGVNGDGEGVNIELQPAGLRRMIDQVIFAASTDESRPTLDGVEVNFKDNRISMAATDGYRLSLRSAGVDGIANAEPHQRDCSRHVAWVNFHALAPTPMKPSASR